MTCTHPQDPADRLFNPKTKSLKHDAETIKAASHHKCMEPISEGWLWVHEDCARRFGLQW